MAQYYIMYQGQVTGPMTREQIFAYGVNRETMVSADGGEWRPLYAYPELMELLSKQAPQSAEQYRSSYGFQRQVGFGEAVKEGFNKYFNFSGRASRSEFWWWILFSWIVSWVVSTFLTPDYTSVIMQSSGDPQAMMSTMMDFIASPGYIVSAIISLALFIPTLAVSVRRLHDTGRSGWWYLLNFVFCIGWIILLVWYCKASQSGENRYGSEPNMTYPEGIN